MQDEIEIEVFRADTRASRGISAADIAAVAEFDCDANPVPCVIGHPKSDSPAEGQIIAFRADGNKLFAKLKGLSDTLVDKLRTKKLLNRSMAFFGPDHEANPTPGKLAPRHLGFLGGSAPGIPGMTRLSEAFAFDADDNLEVDGDPAEAIIFEAPATPVITVQEEAQTMEETPEQKAAREAREREFAAREEKLAADEAAFAARETASREAANKSRVSALVTAGRVLPADAPALELVFNALNTDELTFSADDKGIAADKLAAILAKGPQLVDTSGKAISPTGSPKFAATGDAGKDSATITAAARALMKEDATLTFEAAVERVSENQEG